VHTDLKKSLAVNDEKVKELSSSQISADTKMADVVEKLVKVSKSRTALKSDNPDLENTIWKKQLNTTKGKEE
jgi:hypothetical protein